MSEVGFVQWDEDWPEWDVYVEGTYAGQIAYRERSCDLITGFARFTLPDLHTIVEFMGKREEDS